MSKKQTLAVDFDGVIHAYTQGWQDGAIYDPPVPGALEMLEKLSQRFTVYIFTTRGNDPKQVRAITAWIRSFQVARNLPDRDYEITNEKRPAIAYIDDRALRFTNWTDIQRYFL